MATAHYPKRSGEYVFDVTVTKDETVTLPGRYRARLSNAERIENGLLTVQVDVAEAYGPTVSEAIRALDASFGRGGWNRSPSVSDALCG
jgi:hypothetical protein